MRDVHEHQETFWRQVDKNIARASAAGYNDATTNLVDLRDAASMFNASQAFQERFHTWVRPHLRRAALVKRFDERELPPPDFGTAQRLPRLLSNAIAGADPIAEKKQGC
ncbi:MAG TPA: hypothetical protein VGD98_06405 [Ktedonobacteraceae bacterium]